MGHALQNFYKLYRSGYLSEESMSTKMQQEIDWLLDQLSNDIEFKLEKYNPQLLKGYQFYIYETNNFRYRGDYRTCQQNLRCCHNKLLDIKNTIRTIDHYIDTKNSYALIKERISIHPSLSLPAVKLFTHYLSRIREEIQKGALEKAKLYLVICAGDLESVLQSQIVNQQEADKLKEKGKKIIVLIRTTNNWTKWVKNPIETTLIEKVIQGVDLFIEERKYVLSDRLLDDIWIQIAPRNNFLQVYKKAQHQFKDQLSTLELELIPRLQMEGWIGATHFLLGLMTSHLNNDIQKIPLT